jgi:hypothetical protein
MDTILYDIVNFSLFIGTIMFIVGGLNMRDSANAMKRRRCGEDCV